MYAGAAAAPYRQGLHMTHPSHTRQTPTREGLAREANERPANAQTRNANDGCRRRH